MILMGSRPTKPAGPTALGVGKTNYCLHAERLQSYVSKAPDGTGF